MNPSTDAHSPRILALADQMARFALQFASAIAFVPTRGEVTDRSMNNATVTLVRLNGRQLGITNHHVIEAYRRRTSNGETVSCQIGNVLVDIESLVLSESQSSDLAIVDFSSVDASNIRGKVAEIPCQYHVPRSWPPELPKVGEFVMLGGFPKTKRKEVGAAHFEFGSMSFGAVEVLSSNENAIYCGLNLSEGIVSFDRDGTGFKDPPGISGGPVMVSRTLSSGLVVMDLVGVISEYQESLNLIRVCPLSSLSENGSVGA